MYVVEASKLCNQQADTDVPICLGYDQSHYETFVPDSDEDIKKTITLKEDILSVKY